MKITGGVLAIRIISWLEKKKFKYSMDLQKSDPIHGVYYLTFGSKQEELIAQLRWGLI
jgi:hypothetical protein